MAALFVHFALPTLSVLLLLKGVFWLALSRDEGIS